MLSAKGFLRMVKHSLWPAVLLARSFNLHMFPYRTREFFFLFHQMQVCSHSVRTTIISHGKLPPRSKVWKILFFHEDNKKPTIFVLHSPRTHTLSSKGLLSASHNLTSGTSHYVVGNSFSSLCRSTVKNEIPNCKCIMIWTGSRCSLVSLPNLFSTFTSNDCPDY